jgi:hypothetical protein
MELGARAVGVRTDVPGEQKDRGGIRRSKRLALSLASVGTGKVVLEPMLATYFCSGVS